MKITTAWSSDGDGYYLISAYDEITEDAWGETPEFYAGAVNAARKRDEGNVREMVIEIPDSAVANLFRVPTIQGHAEPKASAE